MKTLLEEKKEEGLLAFKAVEWLGPKWSVFYELENRKHIKIKIAFFLAGVIYLLYRVQFITEVRLIISEGDFQLHLLLHRRGVRFPLLVAVSLCSFFEQRDLPIPQLNLKRIIYIKLDGRFSFFEKITQKHQFYFIMTKCHCAISTQQQCYFPLDIIVLL